MDPVTIATNAVSILQGIKQVSDFLDAAGRVHEVLGDLKREVDSLCGDINNVNNICQDPDFVPAATAYRETSQSRIFIQLQANLKSCIDTIDKLKDLIADVDRGGNGKLINRSLTQLRLEDRAGDCIQIRQQIHTHRGSLQLSVTALHFCMQMQSMKKEDWAGKLINIKMNKLTTIVENQSAEIHRLRNHFEKQGQQVSNEDTQMLQDMEDIHESTLRLKRRATIVVERQTSIKDQQDPAILLPLVPEGAMPAKNQSTGPESRPVLQHIVSAPEQAMHPVEGVASPSMPQRIVSTPQVPSTAAFAGAIEIPQPNRAATPLFHDRRSDLDYHSSSHTAQETQYDKSPMSMEDFDNVMSSVIANAEREKQHPSRPFEEKRFNVIRHLLHQVGKPRWSERPRTYLVLRLIDEVQAMDGFVLEGLKVIHFPYTEDRLPACVASPGSRYAFLEKQSLVMSNRAADLVCRGPHRHLSTTADTHFTIIGTLGKGGQGTVDLIKSHLSTQQYARKRIYRTRTFARNKYTLATFENEIHNLKRLDHIHLVKLVGSYTDPKYVGLIMDPVADTDLKQYLTLGSFSTEQLVRLKSFFGCLTSAVQYLHAQKCRHKDIKPGNILVKDGTVLITDFGTSLDWTELEGDATHGRPVAFTNTYAAPEVAQAKSRNSSADMWSLGCVFLEMITVLKGQSSEERRLFFKQNGTGSPCFHENGDALRDWINVLSAKTSEHEQPLPWIKQMTIEDPSARIEARDLFDQILSFGRNGGYYGQCCSDHIGSEEDSWHGSETDEEDGNVGNKRTESNTISPAVTWTSATSSKSLQSPDQISEGSPSASLSAEPIKYKLPRLPWQDATASTRMYDATRKPGSPLQGLIKDQQGTSRATLALSAEGMGNGASPIHSQSGRDRHEGALHATRSKVSKAKQNAPSKSFMATNNLEETIVGFAQMPNAAKTPVLGSESVGIRATASLQDPELRPFSANDPGLEAYLLDLQLKKDGQLQRFVIEALKSGGQGGGEVPPLINAIRFRDLSLSKELVMIIVGRTQLPNVVDSNLNTPLHHAVEMKRLFLIKYLLSHGADVTRANDKGHTALHSAVTERQTSIVSSLLRHSRGSSIDLKDIYGQTALHRACAAGSIDLVSVLLDHDASVDPIDKAGRTPGMISHIDAYEEISALLDQARESKVSNAGSLLPDCSSPPTAQSFVSEIVSPPHDASSTSAHSCGCEVCKLVDLSAELEEPISEHVAKCLCIGCLERLAAATISDFKLVRATLDSCKCEACFESRAQSRDQCQNEMHPVAKDDGHVAYEKIDSAAIDAKYEAQLQLESNQPPCDYKEWTTERIAKCQKILREGDFVKTPYAYRPNSALALVMDKYETLSDFVDLVFFLLKMGANIATTNKEGFSLLETAAKYGNTALAQMVLNEDTDLNAHPEIISRALMAAVLNRRLNLVYLLMKRGALADDPIIYRIGRVLRRGKAALHWATIADDLEVLKLLLRYHPNLEIWDLRGNTPLHSATINQKTGTASLLLGAGAHIEAPKKNGYKPLAIAIQSRNLEMVKLLLDRGADVHCRCGWSPNALTHAVKTGGLSVFREIIGTSAVNDINACDSGHTIIHMFAQNSPDKDEIPGHLDLLLKNGANLNLEDGHGLTPLHLAVKAGNPAMISSLVEAGANERARNKSGKTPLDLALAKRNEEIVSILGGELKKKWYHKPLGL